MKLLVGLLLPLALQAQVIPEVRAAISRHDLGEAEAILAKRKAGSGVTPEWLEAKSWIARGALAAKEYERALKIARETQQAVGTRAVDGDPNTPIALGAAIEVQAQAMAATGERDQAVQLLKKELARYGQTSLRTRLQKNLNLLTLEGKPAPALPFKESLGPATPSLASLRGSPVVLFLWAHWCGDCKQQGPVLAKLQKEFRPQGLVVIGPTRYYGYVAGGEDAPPAQEKPYIDQVRQKFYADLHDMPVPLSEEAFKTYGVSTTPTLVLIDRAGIVRMYHPGRMTEDELRRALQMLVNAKT